MAETQKEWPKTLEEAVNQILLLMCDKDKEIIKNTPKEDLIRFYHGWGIGMRNEFGLWRGNKKLLASCGSTGMHPDDASMVIIEAVREKLQQK